METVPSVLYILMRHGDDPEQAIIRAATDTYDNDTIATIVGAAVSVTWESGMHSLAVGLRIRLGELEKMTTARYFKL